jgi:hypothetical protein
MSCPVNRYGGPYCTANVAVAWLETFPTVTTTGCALPDGVLGESWIFNCTMRTDKRRRRGFSTQLPQTRVSGCQF